MLNCGVMTAGMFLFIIVFEEGRSYNRINFHAGINEMMDKQVYWMEEKFILK